MIKLDIRRIITKYLSQEATTEEISILFAWVKKEGNQEVFKKIVKADFLINNQNKSWNSEDAFTEFLQCIEVKEKTKILPFYSGRQVWKYAASLLALIASTTYFLLIGEFQTTTQHKVNSSEITLELGSGEIINLYHDNDTIIKFSNGLTSIHLNNGVLYQYGKVKSKNKSCINTLRIPYGKSISVSLEDGSVIRLNSGSELTYPSSFGGMYDRKVHLNGEAFFEIKKNPIKPFIVQTDDMYTQVFGTIFNISAYKEDHKAEVVLIEGSVGVGDEKSFNKEILTKLKPSQKVTNSKNSFVIVDVDVAPYISWVNGVFSFENEQMSDIIKKLERQFNVQIINENEMLGERRFTGMFDKDGVDFILKTIQVHTDFSYTKKGRIIIINKQERL